MNASEPAYPVLHSYEGVTDTSPGLTKRELIAAMCLQGLLAYGGEMNMPSGAIAAISHADALLTELAKEPR